MPKLIQLSKGGVTVIKPEAKVSELKNRGFTVVGEYDPDTKKLKSASSSDSSTNTDKSGDNKKA